jgi:hypothetical protein
MAVTAQGFEKAITKVNMVLVTCLLVFVYHKFALYISSLRASAKRSPEVTEIVQRTSTVYSL